MYQLYSRLCLEDLCVRIFPKRVICRSSLKLANPVSAVEKKEQIKLNENVISSTLSQTMTETESTRTLPLFPSLDRKQTERSPDLLTDRIKTELLVDKSPLSFENIPGPTWLKTLEKYWKYVPLFGHFMWSRNIRPLKYFFNTYGPVVRLKGPFTGNIVLIHRPEHIAKVFDVEGDSPSRSGIDVLQHYRQNYRKYRYSGPYNSQGIQSLQWLETKKHLNISISEQISKQFEKLEMACDELLIRIRQIRNRQDEVPDNFSQELSRWGMECFWILMMSKKMGFLDSNSYNESSEITMFIQNLNDLHLYMSRCESGFQFWRFMGTPNSKKLFNACDIIDGVTGKIIKKAQSNLRNDSLTSEKNELTIVENLLLKHRIDPEELSILLMDMIILGVNATISSEAFLLYYLAKNPRIQRCLYDEIICNAQDRPLSTKMFVDMPYLTACIKECLRLRPPFPYLTRLLSQPITLHGYKIPKGVYLIMANQISSQREENFEDPEKFKPERWLKCDEDYNAINSYLPFGRGLRNCIGENIAKLQMKLLTIKIIREFRIEYDYADINSRFLTVNVPNKPLRFRFVCRE